MPLAKLLGLFSIDAMWDETLPNINEFEVRRPRDSGVWGAGCDTR